jgi:hypothetical protein
LIPRRERQMVTQKVAFRRNSELKMLLWLFERTGNGKYYKTTHAHFGVGIAMGYRVDGMGSIPSSARFFSSPQCPD